MAKKNDINNDRLKNYYDTKSQKAKDMLSKKNNWFYVSLILLSLITLAIAWLIESNTYGVETKAFDGFNFKYFYLILAIMVLIGFFNLVGDYLVIYKKQKTRKFKSVLGSIVTQNYYKLSQINLSDTEALNMEYLTSCGVKPDVARNLSANKTISSKIAISIYSLILVILGSIFAIKSTNIVLYVLSLLCLLIMVAQVLMVLYFDKYKAKYLKCLGMLCKLLYKCKLIKNYEKLYNNTVAKIVHYGSSIKFDKVYLIVQILCGIITKFLKHLILFFILSAFNFASLEVFIEVMFKCVILDLLFEVIPSPSGVLFYELLFLTLFRNTFVTGYVLYGMVGYRLLTYFVIAILFAIGCCVGIRKRFNSMNNDLNCTKKDEF